MNAVFVFCMAVGGVVLVAQVVMAMFGMLGDVPEVIDHVDGAGDALNLLSVRALAAGTVMFGAVGLGLSGLLSVWLATPIALVAAVATAAGTSYLTRLMFRAESRGNLQLEGAVGQVGTVYLRVPGGNSGTGLVQFALQGRTVELTAFTRERETLATGSPVLVISVDPETERAEVVSASNIEGLVT